MTDLIERLRKLASIHCDDDLVIDGPRCAICTMASDAIAELQRKDEEKEIVTTAWVQRTDELRRCHEHIRSALESLTSWERNKGVRDLGYVRDELEQALKEET